MIKATSTMEERLTGTSCRSKGTSNVGIRVVFRTLWVAVNIVEAVLISMAR